MGDVARAMRVVGDDSGEVASFAIARSGRVIQIRVRRLTGLADVERLDDAVVSALRDAGPRASICSDYRTTSPLPPQIVKEWSKIMRGTNGALSRSALLIDPRNALFNLQMERIVRCAANPDRRIFPDVAKLGDWLAGVLAESERAAVGAFLLNWSGAVGA